MNKKGLYKILLFLLLIVVLDRSLGILVSKLALKYKFDRRIELLVNDQLEKDILVIGSSKALNGIDPTIIQENTGMSCYNLGVSGSNIEFHETILDLILQTKNYPKKIIYNIDDPGTLIVSEGVMVYRKEELYPYVYNDYVNTIIADKLDKSVWATKVSAIYHQNVNLVTAIKYLIRGKETPDYEINNVDENGANLMEGHQVDHENMEIFKPNSTYNIEYEHMPYKDALLRIIDKCKKNDIQLIFVFSPSFVTPTIGFKDRIIELTGNKVPIFDYSQEFRENTLFYNFEHLNKKGAQKYSNLLSKELGN